MLKEKDGIRTWISTPNTASYSCAKICLFLKVLSLCLLCTCSVGLFLSLLAIGIYRVSRGTNASPTGISAGVCVWE